MYALWILGFVFLEESKHLPSVANFDSRVAMSCKHAVSNVDCSQHALGSIKNSDIHNISSARKELDRISIFILNLVHDCVLNANDLISLTMLIHDHTVKLGLLQLSIDPPFDDLRLLQQTQFEVYAIAH